MQVEFVRAANRMGIPTCLCVHSWDNLTNKGLIHELPDAITVWNEMQRDEAVEFNGSPASGSSSREPHRTTTGSAGSRAAHARSSPPASVWIPHGRSWPTSAPRGSSPPTRRGSSSNGCRSCASQGLGDMQVLARPHPVNPLVGARRATRSASSPSSKRQALSPRGREPHRRASLARTTSTRSTTARRDRGQHDGVPRGCDRRTPGPHRTSIALRGHAGRDAPLPPPAERRWRSAPRGGHIRGARGGPQRGARGLPSRGLRQRPERQVH